MPELLIRYVPNVVPGEYVNRQVRRAPDIVGRALQMKPADICVEARQFDDPKIGYADEEIGLTARPATILSAARALEQEERGISILKIEARHRQPESAGLWVARAILREWVVDPELDLYRIPPHQGPLHETVVTVYPVEFAYMSSKSLRANET
jgi:hypothetical protein